MRRATAIMIGIGAAGLGLLAVLSYGQDVLNLFQSKEEFVRRIWKALGNASMMINRPEIETAQKTILTAQAIHEASWGAARASREAFNYWNLTAGSKWKGPTIEGPDTEYDAAGNVKKIVQSFRRYKSDDEAAIDMLRFIGPDTRYSKAWEALIAGNAMLYAEELRKAGFFTQPLPKYQEGMRKAIQTVVQYLG